MITLTNEFTTVVVEKVLTRNGERLRISSPRLGYSVELDPLELEALTWQPVNTFSRLLATPYGPEDEGVEVLPLSDLLLFGGGSS
ncbi:MULTISPECIES: dihydrodiol dehydrogenase [Thermus]|uniref:Dihydrodiol dehydrogenase n=1 Tax=Thermus scotoductus TaxID=37636 RepID=A0A430R6Y8_THESC|nr:MULTISPECIES: dihydrodiol dehydrogenase [Thermus]RTG95934.1 dihydrodiol dehydrogenase [Thermus scotoductus]RTH03071.1 dihydrodiol dehydrogenase [Thermus scotoductus]RTH17087.1 dihydrodiol dehydrogenase [Thermus scotoductus]RTH97630.1 dihydrodiol dehydrogenase [Thermus scotoductus]RTI18573.1 dihydrodiol dehydrogenase [Thermus scotoductus]